MGLIFKDDPEKEARKAAERKAKEAAKTVAQNLNFSSTPKYAITPEAVNNMAGVADEKFVQMLWDVITQNNITGQDYFEFKQAVDSMAALPIDEKSKFLTTFMIFQSQGCSKETLLSSADKYIGIIKKEQESFNAEFQSQREQKVNYKITQIEEAKKKVEELNKQILEANNFILTASQEAQQEEMKLQMTSSNFARSAEKVLSAIEGDKAKITNYLA